MRLAAAMWNAVTTLAIFLFAIDAGGSRRAATGAAILFAVSSTAPDIEGFTANAELFAVLPLVVSADLAWHRRWFWAGLVGGLAIAIKPSALSILFLVGFWIWTTRGGWRANVSAAAGFAVFIALSLMHIALIDWWGFWREEHQRTVPVWFALATLAIVGLWRANSSARRFGIVWIASSFVGMSFGGAWSAAIYPLSQRKASAPYLFWDQFHNSPEAYGAAIETIQHRDPAVIVWVNEPPPEESSEATFRTVLESAGYQIRRTVGQIKVYGR